MKKLIAMTFVALLYCGPAAAQGPTNVVDALLGPTGPVQGLVQSLEAANLQPLVDGLAGNNGLIQGNIANPLNDTLSGLLVNQDPNQFAIGLQTTLTLTVGALANGLAGGGGGLALPGLGASSSSLALPGLDGGSGFSASQLDQVTGLLGN